MIIGTRITAMTRYGPQFGPDITFLGVPRCDLDEPGTYADADVVILGAPSMVAPRTARVRGSARWQSG